MKEGFIPQEDKFSIAKKPGLRLLQLAAANFWSTVATGSLLIILGVAVVVSPLKQSVFAATLQELSKQKTELQKAIDAKKKEAEQKQKAAEEEKKRQAQLQSNISKIEKDINATESRIGDTENQIRSTELNIADMQKTIDSKEIEIEKKRVDLYEALVEYKIELDMGNELYAFLGSDRITAALDRTTDLNSLSDKLVMDGEALEKQRQDLLGQKASLEEKRQSLATTKNQLNAYQNALDSQKAQKEVLVGQSKQAQQTFVGQANEANKAADDLKKQFAAVANEEAAMRRASSKRTVANASRNGATSALGFVWPVGGIITTNFGGSTPFQNFHTGLDIAGQAGDAVVATSSGVVKTATKMCCSDYANTVDKSYGYGNWIEIHHDSGYNSRYAHLMQMLVSPGQRVERGQTIGYRGGSLGMAGAGWSTGAHLHFEIWDAQGPFDPLQVLP